MICQLAILKVHKMSHRKMIHFVTNPSFRPVSSRPPVPPPPSPAAACVKAPSGSQAAARREGKSNISSSSAVASVVAHAPLGCVDYAAMAAAQGSCPEVQKAAASPALQTRRLQIHGADVLCDVSTGVARPLVPAAFTSAVFAAIHGLAHPGIRATRRLVSSRFVWRGCAADTARHFRGGVQVPLHHH